jgi:hypothetical protein
MKKGANMKNRFFLALMMVGQMLMCGVAFSQTSGNKLWFFIDGPQDVGRIAPDASALTGPSFVSTYLLGTDNGPVLPSQGAAVMFPPRFVGDQPSTVNTTLECYLNTIESAVGVTNPVALSVEGGGYCQQPQLGQSNKGVAFPDSLFAVRGIYTYELTLGTVSRGPNGSFGNFVHEVLPGCAGSHRAWLGGGSSSFGHTTVCDFVQPDSPAAHYIPDLRDPDF